MDIEALIKVILGILIMWIAFFLTVLIHEVGHMIGYVLCSKKEAASWYITVGCGKQLLRIRRLIICLVPFAGSFRLTASNSLVPKKTALITLAAGPIASLLLATILLVINWFVLSDDLIVFMIYSSLFQFIFSVIPVRYPAWLSHIPESDGLKILRLLKKSNHN